MFEGLRIGELHWRCISQRPLHVKLPGASLPGYLHVRAIGAARQLAWASPLSLPPRCVSIRAPLYTSNVTSQQLQCIILLAKDGCSCTNLQEGLPDLAVSCIFVCSGFDCFDKPTASTAVSKCPNSEAYAGKLPVSYTSTRSKHGGKT